VAAVTLTPITAVERLTAFAGTDLEDLCEASAEAINSGGGFGWVRTPKRHLLESYWKGVALVTERQLLVARLDASIAGSIQLARPPRSAESQSHQTVLSTLFVAPWARGHGLGAMLIEAAEKAARDSGAAIVNLDVRETQSHAIRLFEAHGYVRWGIHPAYALVDNRLVRGFFYYKPLTDVAE
jgi:ribosomal protein S18 acetylase RimI-like enzyme